MTETVSHTTKNGSYYVVTYKDPSDGKNASLKVKIIKDSELGLGFISMSEFIFDPSHSPIIDPHEEQLRKKFENTKALHLSIYTIISIEEVGDDHSGLRFTKDKTNLLFIGQKE